MIVEVFERKWGQTVMTSVRRKGAPPDEEDLGEKLREIEGEDWEDCMKKHHELMGWEPYLPIRRT